jgi:hypothetical protein
LSADDLPAGVAGDETTELGVDDLHAARQDAAESRDAADA